MLIQKLRLRHGWSQEELATLSGVSARTIQRLEAGGTPSTESLKAIAAVFAVDWSDLKEPTIPQLPCIPLRLMRRSHWRMCAISSDSICISCSMSS
ncbi:helix-turn-helix transcriptional regulator [Sphingomonas sp. RS6]